MLWLTLVLHVPHMSTDAADAYDHDHKNYQIILIIVFNHFNM